MIPYARQSISSGDISAVLDVLQGDWLTQGPSVPAFEMAVAKKCSVNFSIAVNSATSALHLACLSLEVGPGDVVWTTPNTFVASANCALYCGADIDFVDIDPLTFCMSNDELRRKLVFTKRSGLKLPKVVIPVHFGGQSCNMSEIYALSLEFDFKVIEDASHAIGGHYQNEAVGSCKYSDITIFSFHPAKIITSCEGGMALTNNEKYAKKMSLLRSHGITRETSEMTHESEGEWFYQQILLGFNYRMTDIHAALGTSQLKRIDDFVMRRNELAIRYDFALKDEHIQLQHVPKDVLSARHLYVVRIPEFKHHQVFSFLRSSGIGVNLHYIPVHLHPWYQAKGFSVGQFPVSEKYYKEAISLPLYFDLKDVEQDFIISKLKEALL